MAEQHEKALVPQIRFTGFTDPWEQRKLGEVAHFINGRAYSQMSSSPLGNILFFGLGISTQMIPGTIQILS